MSFCKRAAPDTFAVAIAWNLRHYIAWGGCNPLYQGLVDPACAGIKINAWDHVAVQRQLASSSRTRQRLLADLARQPASYAGVPPDVASAEEHLLTRLLPGDIEFFHSVPLPSMTRPFWLHIESLHTLFSPWHRSHPLTEEQLSVIREHYCQVLGSPWCLGVSSHLPETLHALHAFLDHDAINARLVNLPLPLPLSFSFSLLEQEQEQEQAEASAHCAKPALTCPRVLFTVSESHDADFFTCGGHRVLRTWQALCAAGQPGILTMACERPSSAALAAAGVDNHLVNQQTGRSIFWTRASRHELDALMANSHVLLQPADVLCTVDILRALHRGCIPLIAAVPGSARLLQENRVGWAVGDEPPLATPWQRPVRSEHDDEQIVEHLVQRLPQLLAVPAYTAMQQAAQAWAIEQQATGASASSVWSLIRQRYRDARHLPQPEAAGWRQRCLLTDAGLRRAFAGNANPQLRINTGKYHVWSQGGYYVMAPGCLNAAAPHGAMLTPYIQAQTPALVFAHDLTDLRGTYLPYNTAARRPVLVAALSQLLQGFPRVHSYCAHWLRRYRRLCTTTQRSPAKAPRKKQGGTHDAP